MDMQFPAINGGVVTEAIARYCAVNGHAKHTIDGVDTGSCPRCGEVTTAAITTCPHGYGIDPTDECPWCNGEETVEEMTQTGDVTNETRSLFPRVNFRDVQDAELVAECLRESTIAMGKRAANNIKTWNTANAINALGIVEAAILTGDAVTNTPGKLIKDQCAAIRRMLEMIEAVTAQIAALYGTPTADNAKYVSDLLEFVTETREFVDALEMCVDTLTGKAGE